MEIIEILKYAVEHNASDIHFSSGVPPKIRIDNDLVNIAGLNTPFSDDDIKKVLDLILSKQHKDFPTKKLDADLSFENAELKARFRVNVFQHDRGIGIAMRYLPLVPPTLDELGLSRVFYELSDLENGLILITGPTGSGKSTTLAAMIDYINNRKSSHIITVEDPIEYVYECKKSLIQQREVQRDVESFDSALRSALREDPNYILVGEMRDLETVRLALTAAETGHLVFATLHTNSAADSVDRIVDVFPTFEKDLIRSMVADSLRAVVSQRLLKKIGGGRIMAEEVMICTHAIRNLIRENKTPQIYSAIQTGREKGMNTLAHRVQDLIQKGIISEAEYKHLAVD